MSVAIREFLALNNVEKGWELPTEVKTYSLDSSN